MLAVIYAERRQLTLHAECHYTECHCAECYGANASVPHRHTVFMTQTLADVEFKIWLLESMLQRPLFYSRDQYNKNDLNTFYNFWIDFLHSDTLSQV